MRLLWYSQLVPVPYDSLVKMGMEQVLNGKILVFAYTRVEESC
jgi:hypothetical protein